MAEDAGLVPTLAGCIILELAATSNTTSTAFGFGSSDCLIIANCAESLARVGWKCK
jgi:hypothetical protein